MLMLIMI